MQDLMSDKDCTVDYTILYVTRSRITRIICSGPFCQNTLGQDDVLRIARIIV